MDSDKIEEKILKYLSTLVKKGSDERDIDSVILQLAERIKQDNDVEEPNYFG